MRSLGVKVEAVNGEEEKTKPREDPPSLMNNEGEGDEDDEGDEGEDEDEGDEDEDEDEGEGEHYEDEDEDEDEDYEGEGDAGDGHNDTLDHGVEETFEHEMILDVREPAFNWSWWFEGRGSTFPQGR
ncbi:hypothetical protein HDV57DRAFT_514460 [Trichoderma longibrachiatum]|uniref:Uncharacterized protein n=1 Tax=Trichoderma longibrachiatum ATCC 18648 TaxID=983965 RepID=A0A2T4BYR6_TRILO|nr:hypothetical protein M440DRAFT_1338283 [Trichoderma longibrachiatum ATCC 18648]